MRVIDLYHHLSRALYYDLDKKELIEGDAAIKIQDKIVEERIERSGWVSSDDGFKADVWKRGQPDTIYGNTFVV